MKEYDGLSDDELEAKIRRSTLERGLSLLEGEEKIPAGQLISLIGKLGIADEKAEDESKPKSNMHDVFGVMSGLPPERQKELLDNFQETLNQARKELPSE